MKTSVPGAAQPATSLHKCQALLDSRDRKEEDPYSSAKCSQSSGTLNKSVQRGRWSPGAEETKDNKPRDLSGGVKSSSPGHIELRHHSFIPVNVFIKNQNEHGCHPCCMPVLVGAQSQDSLAEHVMLGYTSGLTFYIHTAAFPLPLFASLYLGVFSKAKAGFSAMHRAAWIC